MINNLGIYGATGLPSTRIPLPGAARVGALFLPANNSAALAGLGGVGNDVINIGGTQGPPGPPGPPGPQGPAGTLGLAAITDVTATPYTALSTDYVIAVDVAAPASVILPASPTGTIFVVKDASGTAGTNPITVTASTTIDGAASFVVNVDYGSNTFVFNGTEWNII